MRISPKARKRLAAFGPPLAPVLLAAIFTAVAPRFLTIFNLQNLAQSAAILLILAIGMGYVILVGGIDLSQASLLGLSEVVTAMLVPRVGAWCFPLVLGGGLVGGLITGLLHVRLRVPSFLATLAMGGVWLSTALVLTGGNLQFIAPNDWPYVDWVRNVIAGVPVTVIIAAVAVAIALVLERRTRFGRCLYAIGAGEEAARASGVPVSRYKVFVFGLSGLTGAAAGALYTGLLTSGNPEAGAPLLLLAIVVVVVGGTPLSGGVGGVLRTVPGVLTMAILINGLTFVGMDAIGQQIVIGPILIAAAALTMDRARLVTK